MEDMTSWVSNSFGLVEFNSYAIFCGLIKTLLFILKYIQYFAFNIKNKTIFWLSCVEVHEDKSNGPMNLSFILKAWYIRSSQYLIS